MDPIKLKVKIKSSEKTLYDGEAFAVSSKNEIGIFDILGEHTNFITTIFEFIEVHKSMEDENKLSFPVERGILRVKSNLVEIFTGI